MPHPADGVLRRHLDEPEAVVDGDRTHLHSCPRCTARLADARDEMSLVGAALQPDEAPAPDVDAAWARLQASLADVGSRSDAGSRSGVAADLGNLSGSDGLVTPLAARRGRRRLGRPVVAALAAGVFVSGAAAAAATDWLPVFRSQQVAPVAFSTADLIALPDLGGYGDVDVEGDVDLRQVPDAATAAAETGLDVPEVRTLPRGVSGEPVYRVGDDVSATFTFSAEEAARTAASSGEPVPEPPAGMDGAQVRLYAGPGVAAAWVGETGTPDLVVARAVAPQAYSSGVPFETARDYVLSLPGLSDQVAAQLSTFSADGTALPLPVNTDRFTSEQVEVDGAPATVLATRDRAAAAVIWVDEGVVTVVAGPLDADEVLTVARELG